MKKFSLSLAALACIPLSALSFDVNFSKEFVKKLSPDTLSGTVIIKIESDSEQQVSSKLNIFNEEIKYNSLVEKHLGTYTVRPQYKYSSNNTPKIVSYIGELKYKVNSNKAKNMNQFISKINSLKKSRDTSIVISNLSWKVKKSTFSVAQDVLRHEAINWGQTYTQNLSKDLDLSCELKSISMNKSMPATRTYSMRSNLSFDNSKKENIPVPQATKEKITSLAQYKLECQ